MICAAGLGNKRVSVDARRGFGGTKSRYMELPSSTSNVPPFPFFLKKNASVVGKGYWGNENREMDLTTPVPDAGMPITRWK